jgi:hypothetical protein
VAKRNLAKPRSQSPLEAYCAFVEAHGNSPLKPEEEVELMALDLAASGQCLSLGLQAQEFGSGDRTPGMKLNFERESCYKYPGALSGEPQIPEGEIEYYGICLCPHEDWMLWLRAVVASAGIPSGTGSEKKRVDRLADIQRLIKVVERKIQDAVNHAVDTWDRYGEPEVLARCRQEDIGLECGLPDYTTSRCFNDEEAEMLNGLWAKLDDREFLLNAAEARRRRRR